MISTLGVLLFSALFLLVVNATSRFLIMSADGLSQPRHGPAPQFSETLQQRAEEALSASIHHASLSAQYLTLAQKYSALAEQAKIGTAVYAEASQLEREAVTGQPANPIAFVQRPHDASVVRSHGPPGDGSAEAVPGQFIAASMRKPSVPQSSSASPGPFYSPSARSSLADLSSPAAGAGAGVGDSATVAGSETVARSATAESSVTGRPEQELANQRLPDRVPQTSQQHLAVAEMAVSGQTISSDDGLPKETASTAAGVPPSNADVLKTAARKPTRRKKSLGGVSFRKLVERLRLAAMEQAEKVRVRTRKGDLKPKIRKTTEEIAEELKRSRKPASISTVVTMIALLLLALQRLEYVEPVELPPLSASFTVPQEEPQAVLMEPPAEVAGKQQEQPSEEPPVEQPEPMEEPMPEPEVPEPEIPPEMEPPAEPMEPMPEEPMEVAENTGDLPETPNGKLPTNRDATPGKAASFSHRSDASRKMLVEKFGGSVGSESAVTVALEWLAQRQRRDGSWDFADVGPCTSPGRIQNPIGGTAYALLPFLAAGNTHRVGPYKRQVTAGLDYLMTVGVVGPAGYDLRGVINKRETDEEPNYAYYVHGAATLALCEAYGMTKDRKLKPACEGALQFLLNSQDPRGGGWRYVPQQPGSTSCTAIQLMALKAGEKAGFRIPDPAWRGVSYYLDSVQVDREGRYGYEVDKKAYDGSVTAMALLSRMYLGWGRDDGDLRKGIQILDKKGPYDNFYYNYFGTQVMKNWGGEEWNRWNGRLRDDLVAWQEQAGDAKGSWAPRDRSEYSIAGGRLLTTCLATLTLEVYYRYEPLLPEVTEVQENAPK